VKAVYPNWRREFASAWDGRSISATLLDAGQMEMLAGGKRGRRRRVTTEALEHLASQVKKQPDRKLATLQKDLQLEYEIQIGITQLWNIRNQMGLRFKKIAPRFRTGVSESQPKETLVGRPTDRPEAPHHP
jgi:transposase